VIASEQAQLLHQLDGWLALLLPVSFLLVTIFVGWRMPRPLVRGELYRAPRWLFFVWWVLLRWVVPPLCVALLLWQLRGFAGLQ
ncbi:MAG: hypothetical protein V2I45_00255, partial [Halieaceae bacterium]|nr:hypothetical protein [Halieaceae bacterium]